MNRFIALLEKIFTRPHLPLEERRQRVFMALAIVIISPVIFGFGLIDLFFHETRTEGLLIITVALIGLFILIMLKYSSNVGSILRFGNIVLLILLVYELAIGGGDGLAFLWFYAYPPATLFLFREKEGGVLVLASWIIAASFLMLELGPYQYDTALGVRFFVTYTLICILAYALESSRSRYFNQLVEEKSALEKALSDVKTLSGLLPICASCKKVRDDSGYWHQVEAYIQQYSQVQFSHGICPDCKHKLYPELYGLKEKSS